MKYTIPDSNRLQLCLWILMTQHQFGDVSTCNETTSSNGWTWIDINSELMRVDGRSDEMFNLMANLTRQRQGPAQAEGLSFYEKWLPRTFCHSSYKLCIVYDILSWRNICTLTRKPSMWIRVRFLAMLQVCTTSSTHWVDMLTQIPDYSPCPGQVRCLHLLTRWYQHIKSLVFGK